MKKFYSLLMVLPLLGFGQNLAENGGMESWTSDVLDVWSTEDGITISQETTQVSEGNSAAHIHLTTATQGDTDFRQSIAVESGTVYNVSVDVYQLDGDGKTRLYVDGYKGYSDPNIVNDWQTITYQYTAGATEQIEVGLRFYDESNFDANVGSNMIIDNFKVEAEGQAATNQVANIAELRAANQDGSIYELTGEAFLTMQQDFRNQKWIQDDTGAILIDDNNGVITTTYDLYDGITGLKGQVQEFNGILQFVPAEDAGAASSTANDITAQVVSIADFNSNPAMYESQLIKIENITTTATGVWENGTNYTFTNSNGEELVVRTNYYDTDYIGNDIPSQEVHLQGIASAYNGTAQLFPRFDDDIFTNLSVIDVNPNQKKTKVAVANGTLVVQGKDVKNVVIYNAAGQKVANSTFVGNLAKGIYIAVIEDAQGNKSSVKFIK